MNADAVLALMAIVRVAEIDWAAHVDHVWRTHNHKYNAFVILTAVASIMRFNTVCVESVEGNQAILWPKYLAE